jgi:hypothetical protein
VTGVVMPQMNGNCDSLNRLSKTSGYPFGSLMFYATDGTATYLFDQQNGDA